MADNKTNPHFILGCIEGVIDMLDQPEIYRMTPERGLERIREIIRDYKLNREANRG